MDGYEVSFAELDECARQLLRCGDRVATAAGLVAGLAPNTGRSDTTTMASNAAIALHEEVSAARATLARYAEQLRLTAEEYRHVDENVAARLATRES